MTRRDHTLAVALLATATWTVPALAQNAVNQLPPPAAQAKQQANVVDLSQFHPDQLQNAWLADDLRGAEVYGVNGDEVGNVQSIIVGQNGQIQRLIIESGGFLDIGDTVLSVPWKQIDMTPGEDGIQANIDASNVDDFSLFNGRETANTGPHTFRAGQLEGSLVRLQGGQNYGYVRDLVFSQKGQLQALVVQPDVSTGRGGYYAYPYYDYGWMPGSPYYDMPYTVDQTHALPPVGYPENWGSGV